ncbi:hypothetical protein [Nocardia sp. R7R-8]|uniref:hypothetical protein n=1 Tax=Nocardia sp. R7R-8 TaxID=3459304 RepID=UPI00403D71D1
MSFYIVEPEVAGGHGPGTEYDRSPRIGSVNKLEYVFSDWLGDALVTSTPCFLVTSDLREKIESSFLTGVDFADLMVSVSPEGEELMDRPLPEWKWLVFTGKAYLSDFGLNDDLDLVVSSKALAVLREAGIEHADVVELEQEG